MIWREIVGKVNTEDLPNSLAKYSQGRNVELPPIEVKDALVEEWPEADIIICNPPYYSVNRNTQGSDWRSRFVSAGLKSHQNTANFWVKKSADLVSEEKVKKALFLVPKTSTKLCSKYPDINVTIGPSMAWGGKISL